MGIITIIPRIELKIRTGYSILYILNVFKQLDEITKTKKPPIKVIIFISEDIVSITTLSLNKVSLLTEKVSLIVIIPVIKIANKDKLKVIFELFFLNTPKTSKNIIESEINISGNTKFKFSILFASNICVMHIN